MSLNKRIKGDFNIESVDDADSIAIKSQNIMIQGLDGNPAINTVTIDGHLIVTGDTNTVSSTNTEVTDTFITLNAGETGLGVSMGTAGIIIDRGAAPNGEAGIRFNEAGQEWELKNGDGLGWQPITSGTGGNDVVDDLTPQLGGSLDVNGHAITSAANGNIIIAADGTGELRINQELSLQEQLSDETPTAGYNKIYAKVAEGGGTGLFVSNNTTTDELVSKKRAIVFGIIF